MMTSDEAPTSTDTALLAACAQAVSDFLDEQLEALLNGARDAVLVAARDAGDRDEEDRLLSVLEEVEALGPQAADSFRAQVMSKLQSPGRQPLPASGRDDDDGLALVATAKVDDWVRLRRLLERHPAQATAVESRLWARLSAATGLSPHPDDCPISLQGMLVLFQEAMQNLGAGREARTAIYDALEATLVARLSDLSARVTLLLDRGPLESTEGRAPAPIAGPTDTLPADGPPDADGPQTTRAPDSASGPADRVDPTRLLGALAGARRQGAEALDDAARESASLEERLAAAVAPPEVTLDASERRTVAAVADLLQRFLHSPDLDDGIKRRMELLAPPLVVLALQDDDYLEAELGAARHDPITGLLDRAAFRARLRSALRRLAGGGKGSAVCLVDVDDFRVLTARVGHQVGGRVLRALGALLRQHAGPTAHVARLRGDEFAVLLPGARPGAGRRFATRYLAALADARFVVAGEALELGVSIGVVEPDPRLDTAGAVMQAADAARTAAKRRGGRCLEVG